MRPGRKTIGRDKDRRYKLTHANRRAIRTAVHRGSPVSKQALKYGVSRSCIYSVISKDRREKIAARAKASWRDFYDPEKNKAKCKRYREHLKKEGSIDT